MRKNLLALALVFSAAGLAHADAPMSAGGSDSTMTVTGPNADMPRTSSDDVGTSLSGTEDTTSANAVSDRDASKLPDSMFTKDMVLNKVHAIDQEELAGAKVAKANGTKLVAPYADRMTADHTDAETKVTALAKQKGVTLTDAMGAPMPQAEKDRMQQHMAMMDKMKAEKGTTFDRDYLTMMSQGHTEALDYLKQAQSRCKDDDVKQLVSQLAPTVQQHKAMADDLLKKAGTKVQGRR